MFIGNIGYVKEYNIILYKIINDNFFRLKVGYKFWSML